MANYKCIVLTAFKTGTKNKKGESNRKNHKVGDTYNTNNKKSMEHLVKTGRVKLTTK